VEIDSHRVIDDVMQACRCYHRPSAPPDWSAKVESALRIFGADRALLLIEGIVVARAILLGIAHPFRRR
jgi:hypothetical protein